MPRGVRRGRGREKFAARYNHIGKEIEDDEITLSDFYNNESFQNETLNEGAKLHKPQVMASDRDNRWTIVRNNRQMGNKTRREGRNKDRNSRRSSASSPPLDVSVTADTSSPAPIAVVDSCKEDSALRER